MKQQIEIEQEEGEDFLSKRNKKYLLEEEDQDLEAYDHECPHEYEHIDHLETVADQYRRELYVCMFCNKEKVVKNYFGVRD